MFGYAIDSERDNWRSRFAVKIANSALARSGWRRLIGCQIEMSSRQLGIQIWSSQRHQDIKVEDIDVLATWTALSHYDTYPGVE